MSAFVKLFKRSSLQSLPASMCTGSVSITAPDFASSAPAVALAAAAGKTNNIRLFPAVSVLSTDDPVRVFQQYATLDAVSDGRAELLVGRGSFIESFPLFGYSLDDYNELFSREAGPPDPDQGQRRSD